MTSSCSGKTLNLKPVHNVKGYLPSQGRPTKGMASGSVPKRTSPKRASGTLQPSCKWMAWRKIPIVLDKQDDYPLSMFRVRFRVWFRGRNDVPVVSGKKTPTSRQTLLALRRWASTATDSPAPPGAARRVCYATVLTGCCEASCIRVEDQLERQSGAKVTRSMLLDYMDTLSFQVNLGVCAI